MGHHREFASDCKKMGRRFDHKQGQKGCWCDSRNMSSTRKAKGFLTLGRNAAAKDGSWVLDTHGKHTADMNRPSNRVKEHAAMGQTFDRAPGG
jgi:hypothetical protein